MKYHLVRVLLLSLVGTVGTAYAQTDLSFIFTRRPKNTFTASMNIRTTGSKVGFSNLGNVPVQVYDPSRLESIYDDGFVGQDGKRANEAGDPSKITFNADHTRYTTYDSTGKIAQYDLLAYQDGKTRVWGYNTPEQAVGGYINMHSSSASSTGATGEADGGGGAGFDLQLAHEFGLIGKRLSWGVVLSLGLNDINAKVSKTVTSDLVTRTDKYDLFGVPAPTTSADAPYSAPSPSSLLAFAPPEGTIYSETTVPISQTPVSSSTSITPNGAQVQGRWQLKASYYLIRLGPQFRYQFSNRFSISGTAGPAAAVAGSTFRSDETVLSPTLISPTLQSEVRKRYFKFGAYAEINAEMWITYRTGVFAGAVYEHLGKYEQTLLGQKANVDIGSGTSFRLGVITRF